MEKLHTLLRHHLTCIEHCNAIGDSARALRHANRIASLSKRLPADGNYYSLVDVDASTPQVAKVTRTRIDHGTGARRLYDAVTLYLSDLDAHAESDDSQLAEDFTIALHDIADQKVAI